MHAPSEDSGPRPARRLQRRGALQRGQQVGRVGGVQAGQGEPHRQRVAFQPVQQLPERPPLPPLPRDRERRQQQAGVLGRLGPEVYQFQEHWITYRSTAEALKHEQYLYLAKAGPYTGEDRHHQLAERIEGLVSQEHAKWAASQRQVNVRPADR